MSDGDYEVVWREKADMTVLRVVGSFYWVYKDNRSWGIFIKLSSKRKMSLHYLMYGEKKYEKTRSEGLLFR
ncbi:hypothetical protein [Listeria seeligeri]|uniref:hypothetical protein n=1 Tax=Listeria seeligeri TaxID=1640 RepID=UPI0016297F40|nr:hypothetical protein [Listeria seeligeri]MBC1932231.1 hypothetical protein [Listeria seeligeri]